MFGNLVNNRQLKDLLKQKVVEIEPFDPNNLSTVHYTLHINKVKVRQSNGIITTVHDFNENKNPFTLKAGQYVIVEIMEKVKLNCDAIVGKFIPASSIIELGIAITAGKIDKKYGTHGPKQGKPSEMIVFGVKNQMSESDVQIEPNMRIAHMELYDLRGVGSDDVVLTEDEKRRFFYRYLRAASDGVDYGDGS